MTLERSHAREKLLRRLTAFTLVVVTVACVHARDINAPAPGAIEANFPDSAHYVFDAAIRAMNDEPISIVLEDRRRGLIQSQKTGVGSLRTTNTQAVYVGAEDEITFRFWIRQALGVTHVAAEAVFQPVAGGGRASERMVRPGHLGREAIARVFERMEKRLAYERAERERKLREAEQTKTP